MAVRFSRRPEQEPIRMFAEVGVEVDDIKIKPRKLRGLVGLARVLSEDFWATALAHGDTLAGP